MQILTLDDIHSVVPEQRVTNILNGNPTALDKSESWAVKTVRNYLARYDWDTIVANIADYQDVVGWILTLTVYRLYDRVPDAQVPPRVVKNYDDSMAQLGDIAKGDLLTTLPAIQIDNQPDTRRRFGSRAPHDTGL